MTPLCHTYDLVGRTDDGSYVYRCANCGRTVEVDLATPEETSHDEHRSN